MQRTLSIVVVIILAMLPFMAFSWPNAYCSIQVKLVDVPCDKALDYFVTTIKNYTFEPVREKNYTLVSMTGQNEITYIHTTPVHNYVDDGHITLTSSGVSNCMVEMKSKSRATSVLDFSTNYCNSYNLLRPGNFNAAPHTHRVTDKSTGAGTDPSQCDEY